MRYIVDIQLDSIILFGCVYNFILLVLFWSFMGKKFEGKVIYLIQEVFFLNSLKYM